MVKNEHTDLHRSATRFLRPDVIFASGYCRHPAITKPYQKKIYSYFCSCCVVLNGPPTAKVMWRPTAQSLIRQTGEAGNRSCDKASGSYIPSVELSCPFILDTSKNVLLQNMSWTTLGQNLNYIHQFTNT